MFGGSRKGFQEDMALDESPEEWGMDPASRMEASYICLRAPRAIFPWIFLVFSPVLFSLILLAGPTPSKMSFLFLDTNLRVSYPSWLRLSPTVQGNPPFTVIPPYLNSCRYYTPLFVFYHMVPSRISFPLRHLPLAPSKRHICWWEWDRFCWRSRKPVILEWLWQQRVRYSRAMGSARSRESLLIGDLGHRDSHRYIGWREGTTRSSKVDFPGQWGWAEVGKRLQVMVGQTCSW